MNVEWPSKEWKEGEEWLEDDIDYIHYWAWVVRQPMLGTSAGRETGGVFSKSKRSDPIYGRSEGDELTDRRLSAPGLDAPRRICHQLHPPPSFEN